MLLLQQQMPQALLFVLVVRCVCREWQAVSLITDTMNPQLKAFLKKCNPSSSRTHASFAQVSCATIVRAENVSTL